jgi:DNA-binding IclR family transcriptional regulator
LAEAVDITIVRANRKRGRPPETPSHPGPAASRLLALLDRPRRGEELRNLLGVTRQRVHQLVVTLLAFDLIRTADPDSPTFVVARKDDLSALLRPDQERVLSAFPEAIATTLSKIAQAVNMPRAKVVSIAASLRDTGLIERGGRAAFGDLHRLSAAGSVHWQRSLIAPQAEPPPLPFRSDRVLAVLSCLESQGPIRTRDVGLALGISRTSMNALMQYLKRRKAVRIHTDARNAPYELTPDGRAILAAMRSLPNDAATM